MLDLRLAVVRPQPQQHPLRLLVRSGPRFVANRLRVPKGRAAQCRGATDKFIALYRPFITELWRILSGVMADFIARVLEE